uniref:cation transporter n=1 Tax=Geodermatophilus chilensis TaxID=2035835 RepID=UPI0018E4365C
MSSATQHTNPSAAAGENQVELASGGMTCASCAARIEKKLNRLEGVTATVNYATEKAKVTFSGDVTPDDLIATVEKTGYTAQLPEPPAPWPRPEPGPAAGTRRELGSGGACPLYTS